MSAWLVIAAVALAGASGLPGLFLPRAGRAGERLAAWFTSCAALCACAGAFGVLLLGWSGELVAGWPVPGGRLSIRVDALSALFVIPISLLAALAAWYGLEYWPQRAHREDGRQLRAFHGAVTAGMLLLVTAGNAVLFLVGWEVMALAAFLLVSTEDEKPSVREAGYLYLVTTRLGTLSLNSWRMLPFTEYSA